MAKPDPVTLEVTTVYKTDPPSPPTWQAPLVAGVTALLALVFGVFNVAHPDVWVRVALVAITGVVVPTSLWLRHKLAGGALLSAIGDALSTLATALEGLRAAAPTAPTVHVLSGGESVYWDEATRAWRPVRATPELAAFGQGSSTSASPSFGGLVRNRGDLVHDPALVRLGRKPVRPDTRNLRLSRYLLRAFLPTPPEVVPVPSLSWGMMANDRLGDCTCAAAGHLEMFWTNAVGNLWTPADSDVVAMYSAVAGYDPATGANDNGAVELDVLNFWRATGLAGHKLAAYAALTLSDHNQVEVAVATFGGTYMGVNLPITAQRQTVWDVPPSGLTGDGAPGSWGGHAVPYLGYNPTGPVCLTWGEPKQLTWAFHDAYFEEGYAPVSPDFMTAKGVDPAGVSLAQLILDAQQIGGSPAS